MYIRRGSSCSQREKSVVSKGKTVKEAVAIALDLMGETMEHVDIEILETESKGILVLAQDLR